MSLMKIDKKIVETIKQKLIEIYNPQFIYIYGSYAWGSPNEISDIDIAVIVKESKESPYLRPQKGTLSLWDITYPIDLIVYTADEFYSKTDYPSSLQCKILKDGEKIYEAA